MTEKDFLSLFILQLIITVLIMIHTYIIDLKTPMIMDTKFLIRNTTVDIHTEQCVHSLTVDKLLYPEDIKF